MKTVLGGSNLRPLTARVGRSRPPSKYRSVLLPEPLAPTIETYSSRSIDRFTPLSTSLALSAEPRTRCTLRARSSGSVCPTDHLHGVVLGGPAGGIDCRDEHDDVGNDERLDVLTGVLAHEQALGVDQALDRDWNPPQTFDGELAESQPQRRAD